MSFLVFLPTKTKQQLLLIDILTTCNKTDPSHRIDFYKIDTIFVTHLYGKQTVFLFLNCRNTYLFEDLIIVNLEK